MIRIIETGFPPRARGGKWTLKTFMEAVDRYHFWFALVVAAGLLLSLSSKAIDASAGGSLLGIVIGHYLGKSQSPRSSAASNNDGGSN